MTQPPSPGRGRGGLPVSTPGQVLAQQVIGQEPAKGRARSVQQHALVGLREVECFPNLARGQAVDIAQDQDLTLPERQALDHRGELATRFRRHQTLLRLPPPVTRKYHPSTRPFIAAPTKPLRRSRWL